MILRELLTYLILVKNYFFIRNNIRIKYYYCIIKSKFKECILINNIQNFYQGTITLLNTRKLNVDVVINLLYQLIYYELNEM